MFFQHLVHWAKKYWAATLSQSLKELKSFANITLQVMEPLASVTIILEQSENKFYAIFSINIVRFCLNSSYHKDRLKLGWSSCLIFQNGLS